MCKTKAIIMQFISFIPMIFSSLHFMPFSIFPIETIQNDNYFFIVLPIVVIIGLYIGFTCISIFKNKKKTYKDYIWIIVLFLGMFYTLPLYWYVNVLRKFKDIDYLFIHRQNGNIQPKLNEKDKGKFDVF